MSIEMQPGMEHNIRQEVILAGNSLVTAKELSDKNVSLENMRTADAMERLLRLGQTREGLAAIVEMHGE